MFSDLTLIVGFVALHIGGLILLGMGTVFLYKFLYASFSLLKRKQFKKSEENDGFLRFFFGGIFTILPLAIFLLIAGIHFLNSFWKFSFIKDILFFF